MSVLYGTVRKEDRLLSNTNFQRQQGELNPGRLDLLPQQMTSSVNDGGLTRRGTRLVKRLHSFGSILSIMISPSAKDYTEILQRTS